VSQNDDAQLAIKPSVWNAGAGRSAAHINIAQQANFSRRIAALRVFPDVQSFVV